MPFVCTLSFKMFVLYVNNLNWGESSQWRKASYHLLRRAREEKKLATMKIIIIGTNGIIVQEYNLINLLWFEIYSLAGINFAFALAYITKGFEALFYFNAAHSLQWNYSFCETRLKWHTHASAKRFRINSSTNCIFHFAMEWTNERLNDANVHLTWLVSRAYYFSQHQHLRLDILHFIQRTHRHIQHLTNINKLIVQLFTSWNGFCTICCCCCCWVR